MNLPHFLYKFVKWWFLDAPKRILVILKRILVLINNEASFVLNLKMLFVPLFGDYTWVGRMMGFIYRTVKIIVGLLVLIVVAIFGLLITAFWYLVPAICIYYIKVWALPLFGFVFVFWYLAFREVPDRRVSEVSEDSYVSCFRPAVKGFVRRFEKNDDKAIPSLLKHPDIEILLKRLELSGTDFVAELTRGVGNLQAGIIGKTAFGNAKKHDTRYVELEHLFFAVLTCHLESERFLAKYKLDSNDLDSAVLWIVDRREELSKLFFWQEDYDTPIIGGVNRAMTGRVTPALDAISSDLTDLAQKGSYRKMTGHVEKTEEVETILGSSSKINVLLIGPPGCGKTSIVKRIAQNVIKGTEDSALKFKRIVAIDTGSLIAGAKSAGDVSQRIKLIMEEVEGSKGIILFFDEIHNLVLASGDDDSAVFSLLEPYFSSGKFQIVGATQLENYRNHIEPNGSFSRLFRVVEVGETSQEETLEILERVTYDLEKEYGVTISFPAIRATIKLSNKLIHERVFPDKAIDILSRTALQVARTTKYVLAEDVAKTISSVTHIPVTSVSQDESEKLLNIEKELQKRVIGQDHAINKIGKAMKRGRVGIRSEGKPIASFLFVGTTGVGKTETAKALARQYFGSEKAMIRVDMSEYQQKDSMSRLIGAPDGSTKGILSEAVRHSPFSLILLDEIEKADAQVLLMFLQVLDDGRLTDSSGNVIDFTNTIIIATSNVGTREIQKISGEGGTFETIEKTAMTAVRDHYAPEFLNRFSGIVVYKPLSMESVRKICELMLNKVRSMAEGKGIKVTFKPYLVDELIKRGYDKEWGARPLARVIEDSVETHLAIKILNSEVHRGEELTLGTEVFEN
jgi:ATP-dependent Clp protease ATP-binding subunit ClpA